MKPLSVVVTHDKTTMTKKAEMEREQTEKRRRVEEGTARLLIKPQDAVNMENA
jgi:hypothetical protein